jgi:SAM-dependent methyltransferase
MDRFRSLAWSEEGLASPAKHNMVGIPDQIRQVRYPFRLMRYWFMFELLMDEARRRGSRTLQVGEVGIDSGQMLAYARDTLSWRREPLPWQCWHGIDCSPPREALHRLGYDRQLQLDLEDRPAMAGHATGQYDVIVLLHVLEHLHEPEAALEHIARWLRPGGLIVGGAPGTPEFARRWWETRLRRRARPRGHVSVISAARVDDWASALGLRVEWLSGAFFMRRKGFPLENRAWWLKANLAFGAAFPAWPGELYWSWRKPAI